MIHDHRTLTCVMLYSYSSRRVRRTERKVRQGGGSKPRSLSPDVMPIELTVSASERRLQHQRYIICPRHKSYAYSNRVESIRPRLYWGSEAADDTSVRTTMGGEGDGCGGVGSGWQGLIA